MSDTDKRAVQSTDSTIDNQVSQLDPVYRSDDGVVLAEVWERSDRLEQILRDKALPDDDAVEFLRDAIRRQVPVAETYRSLADLVDEKKKDPELAFFVILFPGEARDNTGIKDLNDKVLGYQFNGKYIRARQKHIDDVLGGDFSVVGQNYKTAYILTMAGTRKEFDKRLERLDGKLRNSLLKVLGEAEKHYKKEGDRDKLKEIRKLRRALRHKNYKFDIYYGSQRFVFQHKRLSSRDIMALSFIGITQALKAGGIGRYIRKGASVPKMISKFGKAARYDRHFDKRGKRFKINEYHKVVTQAGDLKEFISKRVSKDHKYQLNVIWVETVWTVAFLKRRRRFFPNADVVRAVRKRWLQAPNVRDGNVKIGFKVQKAGLELWLVTLNTLDFIKSFLEKEFSSKVLAQHATASKLLDGLDEKPPKVDWRTMERTLTRDFGPRPVAVLGKASEYIFYSEVANNPEWIFLSMDVRDLGVDLMFLYENSNEEIEDKRLSGAELMKETLKASDPIVERMRFTYERVVALFEARFFGFVRAFRTQSTKAAAEAFGSDVHGRGATPGDSVVAVRILLGGDEIFVAAHPTYARVVPTIIRTLHNTQLKNGKGALNMRTVVAFSKAQRVAKPSTKAGPKAQQRALDKQREANKRAHQQALLASDAATKCLKDLERQNRRIERLIGMLEANDKKKHLAPAFKKRLDKLGLLRLYVQIGYGKPEVLPARGFRRRITRLASGRLSSRDDEHLMDFDGKRVNKSALAASADKLEAEVRKKVGRDNTHQDPPPVAETPKWLDDRLKPDEPDDDDDDKKG